MAAHTNTINHGEYEVETRGMPFETGRTSMASVCSFSPRVVSPLSLSLSLCRCLIASFSPSCVAPLIDDPAATVVVALQRATLTRDTWKIKNASHKTTISPRSLFHSRLSASFCLNGRTELAWKIKLRAIVSPPFLPSLPPRIPSRLVFFFFLVMYWRAGCFANNDPDIIRR